MTPGVAALGVTPVAAGDTPVGATCGMVPADTSADTPAGALTEMMRSTIWLPGARRAMAATIAGLSVLPPAGPELAGPELAGPKLAGNDAGVCRMARMLCPRVS